MESKRPTRFFLREQAWIRSSRFDLTWIIGPALASSIAVLIFRRFFAEHSGVGPWSWLILVVGVDVAHVYGSLFRTYFDVEKPPTALMWLVPLFCWTAGVVAFSFSPALFWTLLAYMAVFHFIRQQYGFMMIYSRDEAVRSKSFRLIDQAAIYSATLYPLIYWHTHLPRSFNWFLDGDFQSLPWTSLATIAGVVEIAALSAYALKEFRSWRMGGRIHWPRNLLLIGTALSWYVGIVGLNSDLAFTFTNIVSHGIPYIALVWLYGRSKNGDRAPRWWQELFRLEMIPVYVAILILLSYTEEGFWDALIWRDHSRLFPVFSELPLISNHIWLALLVPLLALPQSTHYIFDAFVWRLRGNYRAAELFPPSRSFNVSLLSSSARK